MVSLDAGGLKGGAGRVYRGEDEGLTRGGSLKGVRVSREWESQRGSKGG